MHFRSLLPVRSLLLPETEVLPEFLPLGIILLENAYPEKDSVVWMYRPSFFIALILLTI